MFVIPDKFLETTTCDICYKFLSVGPVTVFRNRKTKCGRCSQADDYGVVSQYGLLAEQGVFKCVNRFDGCRQLLRYTQVADHEAVCHSKSHICPVCSETTNIPTFLLMKHFGQRHRDRLLEIPSFQVELATPGTKTYLYRVKDNLFFIVLNITSVETICLNALFLGDQKLTENVTQKFIVYYGDNSGKYETETKACSVDSGGFLMKVPEIQTKYVFVAFHVDLGSLETLPAATVEERKAVGLPRTISLSARYNEKLSLGSTSLLFQNSNQNLSEFILYCMGCSDVGFEWSFVEIKPNLYQLMCQVCDEKLQEHRLWQLPEHRLLLWEWQKKITFSCLWRPWGCLRNIQQPFNEHEDTCPHQPRRQCPVPGCFYEGKLFDLRLHFAELHPMDCVNLNPRGEVYYEELTSIRQHFYFWAYHGFVVLEVSRSRNYFHITLLKLDAKETTSRSPTVAIYENEEFIKTITDNKPYHITSKWKTCSVRCFLKS